MHLCRTRALKFCLTSLAALALVGCGTKPATLTLHPASRDVAFAQTFTQAYAGRTDDGTREFILVSDEGRSSGGGGGGAGASSTKPGDPLNPSAQPPLRQIVYIKLLWQPLSGVREAAVTNASVDWYVLSNTVEGSDDLLLYKGAGSVMVSGKDHAPRVNIRFADLRPAAARGSLNDPIGVTRVKGSFVATADDERLRELLSSTRARTAAIASSRQ